MSMKDRVGAIHEAVSAKAEAAPTAGFANANALLGFPEGLARQDIAPTLPMGKCLEVNADTTADRKAALWPSILVACNI
jgi:hypothetical protein